MVTLESALGRLRSGVVRTGGYAPRGPVSPDPPPHQGIEVVRRRFGLCSTGQASLLLADAGTHERFEACPREATGDRFSQGGSEGKKDIRRVVALAEGIDDGS